MHLKSLTKGSIAFARDTKNGLSDSIIPVRMASADALRFSPVKIPSSSSPNILTPTPTSLRTSPVVALISENVIAKPSLISSTAPLMILNNSSIPSKILNWHSIPSKSIWQVSWK